mgnify:CR=1 FL=1
MARTQIDSDEILDDTIVDVDVDSAAAIQFSKLASLSPGYLIVGSAGSVPTAVPISGDMSLSASGDLQISAGSIVNADVNAAAAIAGTKIFSAFGAKNLVVDTNVLYVDSVLNRVGILTTTPAYPLSVVGIIEASTAVQSPIFAAVANGTLNGNALTIQSNSGGLNQMGGNISILSGGGAGAGGNAP